VHERRGQKLTYSRNLSLVTVTANDVLTAETEGTSGDRSALQEATVRTISTWCRKRAAISEHWTCC